MEKPVMWIPINEKRNSRNSRKNPLVNVKLDAEYRIYLTFKIPSCHFYLMFGKCTSYSCLNNKKNDRGDPPYAQTSDENFAML